MATDEEKKRVLAEARATLRRMMLKEQIDKEIDQSRIRYSTNDNARVENAAAGPAHDQQQHSGSGTTNGTSGNQSNGRTSLLKFLRKSHAHVRDDAPVHELARLARAFGRNDSGSLDPMIAYFIRNAEAEEEEAREKRRRVDVPSATAVKQRDDRTYACVTNWAKENFYAWVNAWADHHFIACADGWFDDRWHQQFQEMAGEVVAEERERARNELNRKIGDVEKLVLTEVVNAANARLAAADKTVERIAVLEQHVTALTRDAADTKQLRERISELETTLWTREEKHAAQAAASEQAIAVAQRETADTRQELKQLSERLRECEIAFAGEQKDRLRRAESEMASQQKIAALEEKLAEELRELADLQRDRTQVEQLRERICELSYELETAVKYDQRLAESTQESVQKIAALEAQQRETAAELIAVRQELKTARDVDARFHAKEQDWRREQLALEDAKRGPRGERGLSGPQGPRGETGRPGRDGMITTVVKQLPVKRFEIKREEFSARPIYADGTRGPAIQLRELFEEYQLQTSD